MLGLVYKTISAFMVLMCLCSFHFIPVPALAEGGAAAFAFPPNESAAKLPLDIDVCLIDNFKTAEILVKGGFTMTAFPASPEKKPFRLSGAGMRLAVDRITESKPAVIKYYAVLKTFPYSHAFRDDKKAGVIETLSDFTVRFGKLSFFTYGCILSPANGAFDIDVRTLFAAGGPFETERECRAFCDGVREKHKTPAFAHPVREKPPVCAFGVLAEPIAPSGAGTFKAAALEDIARIELSASNEILVKNMEFGRGDSWHNFKDARYVGSLKICADNAGLIQMVNKISFDELLKVVVPSEIEPRSPYQAVCAQAVAARSEVLAKFRTRHTESDYDFCSGTHCQAYGGIANRRDDSSRAVEETSGKIVFSNGHIVDTVYHANCGGVTEDSNKIWSAPFDPALVKINDSTAEAALELETDEAALRAFILKPPPSYCCVPGACANPDKFRWKREFGQNQIDEMIRKQFDIGRLETIEIIGRGRSGRVIAIELKGSKKSEKVYKELPIRKLFGMLRSSLFTLDTGVNGAGEKRFVFRGAGWGHGVGLCQDGAKGMAILGRTFEEILLHYYSNSKILNFN